MAQRITEKLVKGLKAPTTGNRRVYDDDVKGFGVRITRAGTKAFVLNYTIDGRERRYTIGQYPDWTPSAARIEAKRLRREVNKGTDPLEERENRRNANTVAELVDECVHGKPVHHQVTEREAKAELP